MKKLFKKVYNKNKNDFIKVLSNCLDKNKKNFIVTANPETFSLAKKDEDFYKLLKNSETTIIPDGIGLIKASKYFNCKLNERIPGVEIVEELFKLANEKEKTIYLFGASKEVLELLVDKLKNDYPKMKIVGYTDGYVKDKDQVFEKMIKLKPDIVLVALGIPLQEKLIYKHLNKFKKGIFVGVGGSFDVLSGHKKRAPKLFIKLNLEWLYRIMKEPKRFKRFYDNNVKFIYQAWKERNK